MIKRYRRERWQVQRYQTGVTLLELMITVAIIGILAAFSMPFYNDYIATAEISAINNNMETIILFEEDVRLASGFYLAGEYDPADPDAVGGLKEKIGWDPRSSVEGVTYIVSAVSTNGFSLSAKFSRCSASPSRSRAGPATAVRRRPKFASKSSAGAGGWHDPQPIDHGTADRRPGRRRLRPKERTGAAAGRAGQERRRQEAQVI